MKTPSQLMLSFLAGVALISSASAGPPVARVLVRDAYGQARVAYVRVSDNRIVYPRIVQQIAQPGGNIQYRPALVSNYRPFFPNGYGQGYYAGNRPPYGFGYYGAGGRCNPQVGNRYPSYYQPLGNNGADAYLSSINRGGSRNGYPSYYRPLGTYGVQPGFHNIYSGPGHYQGNGPIQAVPRPVLPPVSPGHGGAGHGMGH